MQYRNISYSLNIIKRKIHFLIGKRNRLYAIWWGVKLGSEVEFDGICHFERFPGTTIIIGNHCQFRSRKNSNLIGINRPCSISTMLSNYNSSIEIGNNCGFSGTVIGAFKRIKIGNNVRCGANTMITDSDWHLDDSRSGVPADVVIKDNVWLGVNAIVLKGVTIGENSLIGANSVVTKNIPANVIAAGNPCKIIKQL
jgi:acetyltransferase-like isoleucine patch superfamily enzyme